MYTDIKSSHHTLLKKNAHTSCIVNHTSIELVQKKMGTKKMVAWQEERKVWSEESNRKSYCLRSLAVILSGPSSSCCSQAAEREALTLSHLFRESLRPDASAHVEVTL